MAFCNEIKITLGFNHPNVVQCLGFYLKAKSLYISGAVSNFYGTKIEIWAAFGPVGNTEKKFELIMSNF